MMKHHERAHVIAVVYDEAQDTPLVLLKTETPELYITLPVGAFEASAIIMISEALVTPQPSIYDVLIQLFREHSFKAQHIELWGSALSGYYGQLRYRGHFFHRHIDISPADGLILALRLHIPIFLDSSMVDTAQKEFPKRLFNSPDQNQIFLLDTQQAVQAY